LLTGKTPFDTESLANASYDEWRRIIREQEPPRPSDRVSTLKASDLSTITSRQQTDAHKLVHHLRGELDWIVMKALEKDRNRRYESASAFAADINRYLHNETVLACPPSWAYRLRKFTRRYRAALATAGLFMAFLLVTTAVSVWFAIDAYNARQASSSPRILVIRASLPWFMETSDNS
jgi:hypothetical protein